MASFIAHKFSDFPRKVKAFSPLHLHKQTTQRKHRASDLCRDPFEALDSLIALGVDRLLTSGQAPTARQGAATLKKPVTRAAGRIVIMPGSSVNPDNAAAIFKLTNASEIHASAREPQCSMMPFRRNDVAMGAPGSDEYSRLATSTTLVASPLRSINA